MTSLTAPIPAPAPALPAADAIDRTAWYRLMLALCTLAVADVFGLFKQPLIQQLPTLAVAVYLGASLLRRPRIARPHFAILALLALWAFALPGLVVNKVSGADSSLFTAVTQPLVLVSVLAPLGFAQRLDARRVLEHLGLLGLLGVGWLLLASAVNRAAPGFDPGHHEIAYLLPLAFVPPMLLRRGQQALLGLALCGALLAIDFRMTSLLAVAFALGALAMLRALPWSWVRLGALAGAVALAFHFQQAFAFVGHVSSQAKRALGLSDNTAFREMMWNLALDEWRRSPIVGDGFTGPTAYETGLAYYEELAPLHNDYLDFLTKGGVVGLALLLAVLLGVLMVAVRNHRAAARAGAVAIGQLNVALAICWSAGLLTIAVNPVLNRTRNGLVFWFVGGLILAVAAVLRRGRGEVADA